MASNPQGYSGTPLAQKLGLREGLTVLLIDAPRGFRTLLKPLPKGVTFVAECDPPHDFVHLFVRTREELLDRLATLRTELADDGTLWVSWPKKASGVTTDVTEDVIRDAALPLGFVDVKVCAVDATWSGLKLMVRRSERGGPRKPC